MNSFSGARSTVSLRGNLLVAWFADANPPVLWQWTPGDTASGFALRQENGRTELVKHDAAGAPNVIAVFSSEERATRALEKLSHALLKQKFIPSAGIAQSARMPAGWKWLTGIIVVCFLIWFAIHVFVNIMSAETALPGLDALHNTQGLAQPVTPQKPAAPVQGVPTDADSLLR